MKHFFIISVFLALLFPAYLSFAQEASHSSGPTVQDIFNGALYKSLKWRNLGPFRGGRCAAVAGVPGKPMTYYMGSTGGGVWKTSDAGLSWKNISDGFLTSGSVGAIEVAPSNPNIIYVGMGEHTVRGVMTAHGDGVYKSEDGGNTWSSLGLFDSRHIAAIRIHPENPDIVFVAVQGALYGSSRERGVFKSIDGGKNWKKVLYINGTTGAADISIDPSNPKILYAGMWDHQRTPWNIRSGGSGSGIFKSSDGGENWEKLVDGLPKELGKVGIAASPAQAGKIYANIEAENGGVFVSNDFGKSWQQVSASRTTYARAWYYIKVVPDPVDPETVYILNAPLLKSIDGGKTFERIENPHTDQHALWINPANTANMILGNDGGATISFNGGQSWSPQNNQPTAQFYRVTADNQFPYHVYGGQQDNTTIAIASRTNGKGIGETDWFPVSGGESAFIALDPDHPEQVFGGSYQGNISVYDANTGFKKDIMAYPILGLSTDPKDMRYRFNWNAPLVTDPHDRNILYHAANVVLKSEDQGLSWQIISEDLTRNDSTKQGPGGFPFINEGAGGENYNTISYLACSPHEKGVIWAGTDDGLVHITKNGGLTWKLVNPPKLKEAIVNSIEVSPHDPASAYVVATRYKFNDLSPLIYYTNDYGRSWKLITDGIASENFVRVVREDPFKKGLLYAGTEGGLYLSYDNGRLWHKYQLNLPICPITDLLIHNNDLIAATSGRGYWILDDLGAIQQSQGLVEVNRIKLFRPKPTYRFKSVTTENPVPGIGQNPLEGVIIDYFLPRNMEQQTLAMEILDNNGNIIRSFSNQLVPEGEKYEGGPPKVSMLPANKGVNRFNWDLRRATLPEIPGQFINGDYKGSQVGPGEYQIRLMHPKDTVTQTCTILADPRLKASPKDFEDQQDILTDIEHTVFEIHKEINKMRKVKQQLHTIKIGLVGESAGTILAERADTLIHKIERWEQQLIQPLQVTYQDVVNFPSQLSAELLNLRQRVDTHDPRLTAGATERFDDLHQEWKLYQAQLETLIGVEIARFNQEYRESQLPVLIVPQGAMERTTSTH